MEERYPIFKTATKNLQHLHLKYPNFLMNVGVLPSCPIQNTIDSYIITIGQPITDFDGILPDLPGKTTHQKEIYFQKNLNKAEFLGKNIPQNVLVGGFNPSEKY